MMLSVAGTTVEICRTKLNQTMQAGWVLQLSGDIGMADKATIRHGVCIPGSGMTGTALLDLSVRGKPAQRCAGCGAQASRGEHGAATGKGRAADSQERYNCD